MGNLTQYELNVEDRLTESRESDFKVSQAIIDLRNISEGAFYALSEDGHTRESCKWYEYEEDLKEFSKVKKYTGVLFTLSGAGEEAGDVWKLYVMNGKSQKAKAKISFDKFDEKRLK